MGCRRPVPSSVSRREHLKKPTGCGVFELLRQLIKITQCDEQSRPQISRSFDRLRTNGGVLQPRHPNPLPLAGQRACTGIASRHALLGSRLWSLA
jgi:hypothetical protein